MRGKQAVARQNRDRYRQASKREKTLVLNEFVQTTGYNRKYALRVLGKRGMPEVLAVADGKPEKKKRPKNRQGKRIYTDEAIACLRKIWAFYWYKCAGNIVPAVSCPDYPRAYAVSSCAQETRFSHNGRNKRKTAKDKPRHD